jgi:hypothetical protein
MSKGPKIGRKLASIFATALLLSALPRGRVWNDLFVAAVQRMYRALGVVIPAEQHIRPQSFEPRF